MPGKTATDSRELISAMLVQFETHVKAACEAVFAFHTRPANLLLLEDGAAFRLLAHADTVAPGGELWVEKRVGVLPIVMAFRHVRVEPPLGFTDALFHGPFARFHHTHRFTPSRGGTLVRDEIDLALPWQFGGEPVLRYVVLPRVQKEFLARHRRYAELEAQGRFAAETGGTR